MIITIMRILIIMTMVRIAMEIAMLISVLLSSPSALLSPMSSISKRNFFPLPPGFSKAGFPDGGMFRKRLEKVILLLCLSVTTAVLVYWRVHNQELSTIIIEQAIEDPYLSLPSNVKENGAWVDRLPRGVVVWSQPLAGSLGVGKLLTSGLKNSLVRFVQEAYFSTLNGLLVVTNVKKKDYDWQSMSRRYLLML